MDALSKWTKVGVMCCVVACLVVCAARFAFAVPDKQILHVTIQQTFTGACCFSWGETVAVTEPVNVAPVVVTFAGDLLVSERLNVGLSLNGGPCRFDLGPNQINELAIDHFAFVAHAWTWVVEPTDGLFPGNNTFTLCGGGSQASSKVTIESNTLAVRISK